MSDEQLSTILPPGPALIYVHSDSGIGQVAHTRVDWRRPDVPTAFVGGDPRVFPTDRERAILRALLTHALTILDYDGPGPRVQSAPEA